MPATDRSHYRGSYPDRAKRVRDAANADPSTRCWRSGLTLAEARAQFPGRRIVWQAGHTIDGDSFAPLLPELSHINQAAGQARGQSSGGTGRF